MSEEEFNALRKSDVDASTNQAKVDSMSNKEFLTSIFKETISVPITNKLGTKNIEIVARMPKAGIKRHETFISKFRDAKHKDVKALLFLLTPDGEKTMAEFLSDITIDTELDVDFWMSDDVDYVAGKKILLEYFKENP